jgi:hypothetical protein
MLLICSGISLHAQTEMRPVLVLPADGQDINTFYPQFVWLPVNIGGDAKIKYAIRVAELKDGQSYADAIQQNIPVWENRDITGTSIQYGIDGFMLNDSSKYVWQIATVSNEKSVVLSDIWMFKYKKEDAKKDSVKKLEFPRPYPELTTKISSNTFLLKDTIQFYYQNYSREDSIEISIAKYSPKLKVAEMMYKGKIALGRDKNYVKLRQVNIRKWTTNKSDPQCYYILYLKNIRRELWQMKFQLIDKNDEQDKKIQDFLSERQKTSKK